MLIVTVCGPIRWSATCTVGNAVEGGLMRGSHVQVPFQSNIGNHEVEPQVSRALQFPCIGTLASSHQQDKGEGGERVREEEEGECKGRGEGGRKRVRTCGLSRPMATCLENVRS